jgi:uncharacterized membrane protein
MTHQGVRNLDNPIRKGPAINVGRNERIVSELGGAALAGFGLAQGNLAGMALAALGGMLVFRGYTGHCYGYQAMGVNTRG